MGHTRANRIALGVAAAISLTAMPAHAVQCVILGLDDDTVVLPGNGASPLKGRVRYQSQRCEDARISIGRARVIYWTQSGGIEKQDVGRGFALPPTVRSASADYPSALARMFDAIGDLLAGSERERLGRVRGSGADVIAAALPSGPIGRPRDRLVVALPLAPDETIDAFVLRDGARIAHAEARGAREVRIPASILREGATYRWTLTMDGRATEGGFTVVAGERVDALRRDLEARADAAGESGPVRALGIAAGLADDGFEWEARRVLAHEFAAGGGSASTSTDGVH